MLPKRRRLTAEQVREVLSRGRSLRSGGLSAKYLPLPSPLRSATVVSKKVARTAVGRNRLRRALYRALSRLGGQGDLVVFVQKIPSLPLVSGFSADVAEIAKKISAPYN